MLEVFAMIRNSLRRSNDGTLHDDLQHLRRYAQALVGETGNVERLVDRTTHLVQSDWDFLKSVSSRKVGLFRAFYLTVRSEAFDGMTERHSLSATVGSSARDFAFEARQAFMLFSMAMFSLPEVAEIIGSTPREVEALLSQSAITRMV